MGISKITLIKERDAKLRAKQFYQDRIDKLNYEIEALNNQIDESM